MRNGKDKHVGTIIGPDVTFEGTLISKECIRIEGSIRGRVECESLLIISTTAKVEAEVICEDIYVAGEVRGNVLGKNLVEVTQQGRIIGNITTANLVMEPGAIFEGKCNMNGRSDYQKPFSGHAAVAEPDSPADPKATAN
jgi:cytoskeletal protein CcmA (bactofilin family)